LESIPESRGWTTCEASGGRTFRLKHRLLFIANALKQHHPIGLEEVDDGIWSIYFGTVLLGRVAAPLICPGRQQAGVI